MSKQIAGDSKKVNVYVQKASGGVGGAAAPPMRFKADD